MIMSNIQCPFGSLDCDYTQVKHKQKNKGNFFNGNLGEMEFKIKIL